MWYSQLLPINAQQFLIALLHKHVAWEMVPCQLHFATGLESKAHLMVYDAPRRVSRGVTINACACSPRKGSDLVVKTDAYNKSSKCSCQR